MPSHGHRAGVCVPRKLRSCRADKSRPAPVDRPGVVSRPGQLEFVEPGTRQQVVLEVCLLTAQVAVVGDVDHDRDYPAVAGNELRALRVRYPEEFAEPLLRILNLPLHLRPPVLSRQSRQNCSTTRRYAVLSAGRRSAGRRDAASTGRLPGPRLPCRPRAAGAWPARPGPLQPRGRASRGPAATGPGLVGLPGRVARQVAEHLADQVVDSEEPRCARPPMTGQQVEQPADELGPRRRRPPDGIPGQGDKVDRPATQSPLRHRTSMDLPARGRKGSGRRGSGPREPERRHQPRLALIRILSAGYSPVLGGRMLVTSGTRPQSRSRSASSAGEYRLRTTLPSGRSSHSSPLPPCVITISTPPGLSTSRSPASAAPSRACGRWCSEYEATAPAQLAGRSGRASRSAESRRAPGTSRAAAASMPGAMSMPIAVRPRSARYPLTCAGPQPRSRTGPSGRSVSASSRNAVSESGSRSSAPYRWA